MLVHVVEEELLEDGGIKVTLQIERETGTYNNITEDVSFSPQEVEKYTRDELLTVGVNRIKHLAIREFSRLEELNEGYTGLDFTLIEPKLTELFLSGNTEATEGSPLSFYLSGNDQFGNSFMIDQSKAVLPKDAIMGAGDTKFTASYEGKEASHTVKLYTPVNTPDRVQELEATVASLSATVDMLTIALLGRG